MRMQLLRQSVLLPALVFAQLAMQASATAGENARVANLLADASVATGSWCCLLQYPALLGDAGLNNEASVLSLDLDEDTKDGRGLARDTVYFVGYHIAAVAILYAMPEDVTGWSATDKEDYSLSKWRDNVSNPQWDTDDFYINYIIHPYWGASYYVRARERGFSGAESFWYSVLLSTMFEFGAEALAEEPSYQDLIATPVLGSLLGAWFMRVRERVRERTDAQGYRSTGDKWIWALTDPLGGINRQVDRMFGVDTQLTLRPYLTYGAVLDDPFARPFEGDGDSVIGLNLTLTWQ